VSLLFGYLLDLFLDCFGINLMIQILILNSYSIESEYVWDV
jgi:hypothetical protein